MANKYKTFLNMTLGSLLLLGSTGVEAANILWTGATADLGLNTNWTGNVEPTTSDVAQFGAAGNATPTTTTGPLTVLGINFVTGAQAYTVNSSNALSTIGASGVVNGSGIAQAITTSGAGIWTFTNAAGSTSGALVNYTTAGTGGITFTGPVTAQGTFTLGSGTTLTNTTGASSIGSLAGVAGSFVALTAGSLTTGTLDTSTSYGGIISGAGSFIKTGTGVQTLTGINSYTGGTLINDGGGITLTGSGTIGASTGTLTINDAGTTLDITGVTTGISTGSLAGVGASFINLGTKSLTVNQTTSASYAGSLTSTSAAAAFNLGATTASTLQLVGDSSAFGGTTTVSTAANLQVNGSLGGTVVVGTGATLSGNGTVGTTGLNVTIGSGGTLSPGITVGTITLPGNLIQSSGSFFNLAENGAATNLALVTGTATINGGTVDLTSPNGVFNFNVSNPLGTAFITSTGALTVNTDFALVVDPILTPGLYSASLDFDANNYYIILDTTFAAAALGVSADCEAIAVATALDAIVDPTLLENTFLSEIAELSIPEAVIVFDELSGSQYATEIFGAEIANRQFIRRLYDPIRDIVTTEPCYNPCAFNPCCEFLGFDVWASAGGGQSQINGHHGNKLSEWDVTLGLQKTFGDAFTVGIAGSYEHNTINYHLNGSGSGHTWFGGLYGLYRPASYYVLADIAYGYTKHDIHRSVTIDTVLNEFRGRPQLQQVTFYAEAGFDWNFCSFLVQPFVGVEVAGFNRKAFTETEVLASDLGLTINKKDRTYATSSLGVHLTDQFCSGFSISVDLAWLYRFTDNKDHSVSFTAFGGDIIGCGHNVGRNSGEGAITFAKDFCNNWRVFVEGSGEIWDNASTYNVLGGLQVTW